MHSACQVGNARIGYRPRRSVQVRTCRGTLSTTPLPAGRKLFARGDPTENTRPAETIISYSPLPRSLIFNTFKARVINGSIPFSISVFLLSSLMSTGTPLPS
jgi:hypothetical protein